MDRILFQAALCASLLLPAASGAENWPQFRGAYGRCVSTGGGLPLEWNKVIGKSSLGEMCMATPAISNGRIFLRGIQHLYCIHKG